MVHTKKNKNTNLIDRIIKPAVIVLVIIAIGLGIAIATKTTSLSLPNINFNQSAKLTPPQNLQSSTQSKSLIPPSYSSDEKSVLVVPKENASDEEKRKHIELAQKLAKEADVVEISDCQPKPLVLKARNKSEIKIANKDSVTHTIIIDPDHTYPIPAGETTTITADFGKPPGLYGYICEGVGLTGFIFTYP